MRNISLPEDAYKWLLGLIKETKTDSPEKEIQRQRVLKELKGTGYSRNPWVQPERNNG